MDIILKSKVLCKSLQIYKPKTVGRGIELERENHLQEVKNVLFRIDGDFFKRCQYEVIYYPICKYYIIIYLPLTATKKLLCQDADGIKLYCYITGYSFAITDKGLIGLQIQHQGFYGLSTDAFTINYHNQGLYKRLKLWYDLFRSLLKLLGVNENERSKSTL